MNIVDHMLWGAAVGAFLVMGLIWLPRINDSLQCIHIDLRRIALELQRGNNK